jgi:ABC-type transport system substrate-binding protein
MSTRGCTAAHNFDRAVSWPAGQLLTGQSRRLAASLALAAICAVAAAACRANTPPASTTSTGATTAVPRGGDLLVSVRTDPRSFNRHAARDSTTSLGSNFTQARLVRINQASALADSVKAGGKKLHVSATDPHTVVITFPAPFAPGVRTLDSLPILPRHQLEGDKSDLDPGTNPEFWFSSGSAHMWNFEEKTPAIDWERRIDELMTRQIASPDQDERKRLYDDVQKIFAEHLPIVHFVAPRIHVAHASRVTNLTPAEFRPQLLWRPDTVALVR